jgi:hypothetical protein
VQAGAALGKPEGGERGGIAATTLHCYRSMAIDRASRGQPMHARQPELKPVAIAKLFPTQMTVGLREVAKKRAAFAARAKTDGPQFLGQHMIPGITGPKGRTYIIDNHHLVRALHEDGVKSVFVTVVADLSKLAKPLFWTYMENRNWLHPYTAAGVRVAHSKIPKSIDQLVDDPFRSLAGEVREAGGYAKDMTPYAEFLWADFLRHRIDTKVLNADFPAAVKAALKLARSADADYLPGWAGPK